MNTQTLAMKFEVVIGLEIHVQLLTASKMFCACPVTFGAPPNTLICPVCLGLPGSLPVLNRKAVDLGLRTAAALGCTMHPTSQFHRKNYYYPDLPKNYQITQYRYKVHPPLATDGSLEIPGRRIGIRRVHLEEDTGRLVHAEERGQVRYSLVDFNRSGVPLMEIVTDPGLRSPQEARIFLARLRAVLQAIEVSTGRMEEGSLRCDANVSLRRPGAELGIRTEVKNMNSLRSVERALAYEVERQRAVLDRGQPVQQETRHWDEHRGITFSSRTKEEAQDYRYFPEPDLVPIAVAPQWVAQVRGGVRAVRIRCRPADLVAGVCQILRGDRPALSPSEGRVQLAGGGYDSLSQCRREGDRRTPRDSRPPGGTPSADRARGDQRPDGEGDPRRDARPGPAARVDRWRARSRADQ